MSLVELLLRVTVAPTAQIHEASRTKASPTARDPIEVLSELTGTPAPAARRDEAIARTLSSVADTFRSRRR